MPEPLNNQLQRLLSYRGRLERPVFPYGAEDGGRPGVVLIAPFGIKDEAVTAPGETASSEDDETGRPSRWPLRRISEASGPLRRLCRLAGTYYQRSQARRLAPRRRQGRSAFPAPTCRRRSLRPALYSPNPPADAPPGAWGRAKLPAGTVGPCLRACPRKFCFVSGWG